MPLHCVTGAVVGTAPDQAPSLKALTAAGALVQSGQMSPIEPLRVPGVFLYLLRLGSAFAPGRYLLTLGYRISGSNYLKTASFDVEAGGDPVGAVVSIYQLERPQADFAVVRTDAGRRLIKRSPYL